MTHWLPNRAGSRQDVAASSAIIAQFEQETERIDNIKPFHIKLTTNMVGPQLPEKTVRHAAREVGHQVICPHSALILSMALLADQLQCLSSLQAIRAWKPSVAFLLTIA